MISTPLPDRGSRSGERPLPEQRRLPMRSSSKRVLRAVKAGRSLTLTYRSKPLARIVPLKEEQALPEGDPIFRLDELAEQWDR